MEFALIHSREKKAENSSAGNSQVDWQPYIIEYKRGLHPIYSRVRKGSIAKIHQNTFYKKIPKGSKIDDCANDNF